MPVTPFSHKPKTLGLSLILLFFHAITYLQQALLALLCRVSSNCTQNQTTWSFLHPTALLYATSLSHENNCSSPLPAGPLL